MKKFMVALLGLIMLFTSSSVWAAQKPGKIQVEKSKALCEYNIKLLSNALELYANEHFNDYPEAREFHSAGFNKYISAALGKKVKDSSVFLNCGIAGNIKYTRSTRDKSYRLEVTNPKSIGCKAIYYTGREGFVMDDGSVKASANNKTSVGNEDEKVSEEDKKIMLGIINDLYNAYAARDLEKVMKIEDEAISRSAIEMEQRGKYKAIEVYYALKGTKNDVFRAEGFAMESINTQSLMFRKKGDQVVASSPVPVIATKQVSVGTMKVRLRIAAFTFEKLDGSWKIVKLQMY